MILNHHHDRIKIRLEVLLPEEETSSLRFAVLVAHLVKGLGEDWWSAEELWEGDG